MNIFKKRDIFQVKSTPVDPRAIPEPQNATDYINRGMAYYARHQYDFAEDDLRRATAMDPNSVDAFYTLGMVYKALQRKDEAVKALKHQSISWILCMMRINLIMRCYGV